MVQLQWVGSSVYLFASTLPLRNELYMLCNVYLCPNGGGVKSKFAYNLQLSSKLCGFQHLKQYQSCVLSSSLSMILCLHFHFVIVECTYYTHQHCERII